MGLIPLIGVGKYADEVATLMKRADDYAKAVDAPITILKTTDEVAVVGKGIEGGTGSLGIVESRINIANGLTRFSPSNKAGLEHVVDRHFNLGKNAGQFTISVDELKTILGNKDVINAPLTVLETSGQYSRTVNVGEVVGTIKPSIPDVGGKSTTWMEIITDSKGNLITTYPSPAPK